MGDEQQFMYHGVELPKRESVRDPMPRPILRLLRLRSGRMVEVQMNEAQLLNLITQAARTLDHMRQSRDATTPGGPSGKEGTG